MIRMLICGLTLTVSNLSAAFEENGAGLVDLNTSRTLTGKGLVYSYCDKQCNPIISDSCIPCPSSGLEELLQNNLFETARNIRASFNSSSQGGLSGASTCSPSSSYIGINKEELLGMIRWMDTYSSQNIYTKMQVRAGGSSTEKEEFYAKFEERHPQPAYISDAIYDGKKKDSYRQYRYRKETSERDLTVDEALDRLD